MTSGALPHRGSRFNTLAERFWPKVKRGDGCWVWLGCKSPEGYGYVMVKGRQSRAHRVSWELANGRSVPDGLVVCHACDNPPCVRPDHLFIGTARDNRHDAMRKGRAKHRPAPRGEANQNAKITAEIALSIFQRLQAGEVGRSIADDFGVSMSAVYFVGLGRTWRHVTGLPKYQPKRKLVAPGKEPFVILAKR